MMALKSKIKGYDIDDWYQKVCSVSYLEISLSGSWRHCLFFFHLSAKVHFPSLTLRKIFPFFEFQMKQKTDLFI